MRKLYLLLGTFLAWLISGEPADEGFWDFPQVVDGEITTIES